MIVPVVPVAVAVPVAVKYNNKVMVTKDVNAERILLKFSKQKKAYFFLPCVSHTSTPHDRFLSTDTAGSVHLCLSWSMFLQYGGTSWCLCHCSGLLREQQLSETANKEVCDSNNCVCILLTP